MNKQNILKEIIFSRRSITPPFYDPEKRIDDDIVWEILESANMAPNHKRTEPWRFTVFTGDGLKKFSAMQADIYPKHAGEKFSPISLKKLTDFPLMASHIIAVTLKRNEEDKLPEVEEILACGCAIQNIFLTATANGIASYISTGGITYFEQTKEQFDLLEDDRLLGFIYLGYTKPGTEKTSSRGNIKEKVKWVNEFKQS